jgi:hypothetical protein
MRGRLTGSNRLSPGKRRNRRSAVLVSKFPVSRLYQDLAEDSVREPVSSRGVALRCSCYCRVFAPEIRARSEKSLRG